MRRRIDGRPQRRKAKKLGAKKIGGQGSGCLIALVTFAAVAAGWLSMILTQTTG